MKGAADIRDGEAVTSTDTGPCAIGMSRRLLQQRRVHSSSLMPWVLFFITIHGIQLFPERTHPHHHERNNVYI